MIGHRVRIILVPVDLDHPARWNEITGTLHKLDQAGAIIWREHSLPEGQGNAFIPIHRIVEIIDLGRAPIMHEALGRSVKTISSDEASSALESGAGALPQRPAAWSHESVAVRPVSRDDVIEECASAVEAYSWTLPLGLRTIEIDDFIGGLLDAVAHNLRSLKTE